MSKRDHEICFLIGRDNLGSSVLFDSTFLLGVTRIGPIGPELPWASVSKRVFMQNLSDENELDLHEK